MTDNELTKTAAEYMSVWNAGNEHLLDKLADGDLVVDYTHFEKPYKGISEYKSVLKMTHNYFPDLKIDLDKIIPNEKEGTALILWNYNGTHKNGNLFGVEPSGKHISVKGMTLLEILNGKVKKDSGIVDNLSLLRQLGALSS